MLTRGFRSLCAMPAVCQTITTSDLVGVVSDSTGAIVLPVVISRTVMVSREQVCLQPERSVVVASSTRSTAMMTSIVGASGHTTIVQGARDFALNTPGAAQKSPSVWARI